MVPSRKKKTLFTTTPMTKLLEFRVGVIFAAVQRKLYSRVRVKVRVVRDHFFYCTRIVFAVAVKEFRGSDLMPWARFL